MSAADTARPHGSAVSAARRVVLNTGKILLDPDTSPRCAATAFFGFLSFFPLIALAFCMTALSMPMRTYIPVFVKDFFHRGPETYGNLLSMMGIGSICGSLIIAGLGNIAYKGRLALTTLISLGAGISVFSLSRSLTLSYAMLVLVGASMMAVFATVTSLVQLITTNEMRGRVMSVYNCAFRGGMPMGNLLSGWLVPVFTAPVVLGANGLALILMALYFFLVQRRVAAL